jgi:short-subunit dehydrogenase
MDTRAKTFERAVVTGASAGIGAAFARRLAAAGTDLVVVARSADRLGTLADELREAHGVQVSVVAADLTDPAELGRVEALVGGDGHLDLLVNNAGFGTIGDFAELDPDGEEREIRLNVVALVRLARAALPGMLARRRGAIVNVSSMAAFQPAPYNATYGATKAYVNSFTEALGLEVEDGGVRVQALCPGFTRTEFQERAGIDTSAIPAVAWMTADDVAAASLDGLERGGIVLVPGAANRATIALAGLLPRRLVTRALGAAGKRLRST